MYVCMCVCVYVRVCVCVCTCVYFHMNTTLIRVVFYMDICIVFIKLLFLQQDTTDEKLTGFDVDWDGAVSIEHTPSRYPDLYSIIMVEILVYNDMMYQCHLAHMYTTGEL